MRWPVARSGGLAGPPVMRAETDAASGPIDVFDNDKPVLRYNYQTVEPGAVLEKMTPNNRKYVQPRSDYIHPLYGLNGEVLTRDWSVDHPHHRGIYWAWPEVVARKQSKDFTARALYNIKELQPVAEKNSLSPGHKHEWIDCIKSRQQPSCSVFYHTCVDVPLVLSLLSLKLGRRIKFDPVAEKIHWRF